MCLLCLIFDDNASRYQKTMFIILNKNLCQKVSKNFFAFIDKIYRSTISLLYAANNYMHA